MNNIIKTVFFSPLMPLVACSTGNGGTDRMPNIVFILADDMGYGELTCYNPSADVETENIDRLAETGIMMTQAYASPVSSPTRTAFLTGAFHQHSGVYGNPDGTSPGIGPQRPCFVKILHDEFGYNTGWFGKWHQGWDVSNHPLNNGFDTAYGFLGGMHDYHNPTEGDHYIGGPFARHSYVLDGIKPVSEMKYFTEEITDRAINFISGAKDKGKPFFIYLAYNCPHTPMQAPDTVIEKYLKKGYGPVRATRCAMMEILDFQIGKILSTLENSGLRENTLIVFMSDNGAEDNIYNGGLRGTKMTVWEGGIRVPMIASYPAEIPADTKSGSICSVTDLASTFLGLAQGNDSYSYRDGINLMPYYKGEKTGNAHDTLVFSIHLAGKAYTEPRPDNFDLFAVRSGDWKLVIDRKRHINALYNLKDDLCEKNDLSGTIPDKKEELLSVGTDFLKGCPPSCSKICGINTRINGDRIKTDSLIRHCNELMKKL